MAGSGRRGAQELARARARRRRPNITGPKRKLELVLSESEWEQLQVAAEQAHATVQWYLVQSALVPASLSGEGAAPRLPWPKRQALAAVLVSATGALDEVRLSQLAKIGGNLNQIAHSVNTGATVAEEVLEVLSELQATMAELRERAEEVEALARDVVVRA